MAGVVAGVVACRVLSSKLSANWCSGLRLRRIRRTEDVAIKNFKIIIKSKMTKF